MQTVQTGNINPGDLMMSYEMNCNIHSAIKF